MTRRDARLRVERDRNGRRRERPARFRRRTTAWSNHWARLLKERGGW